MIREWVFQTGREIFSSIFTFRRIPFDDFLSNRLFARGENDRFSIYVYFTQMTLMHTYKKN